MVSTERCLFLKDFLLHPSRIGSITPSSSQLTRKMLSGLPWEELNTIVELGAGTGVFTKYVMEHRKPDSRFLVIEQDTLMRRLLMKQFPQALFGTQAECLPQIMRGWSLPKADCIISGLPFAVIPKNVCLHILAGIDRTLTDDGIFVAFQYSPQMYETFRRIFRKVEVGFTFLNLPPAFIYVCRK
ncbi:MAG: class I SAM-dependent methyltransferase [Selenomonas noxia]